MPRGRRPLPTAIKKLRGNPGKRALNLSEPTPPKQRPEKMAGLTGEAAAEWDRIVPDLEIMGVLTRVDRAALGAYCFCYARWFAAEKEVESRGILIDEPITDKEGNEIGTRTKKNPACIEVAMALKLMKSFLVEFGLTPASRARIHIEKPKEIDPMEAYLERRTHAQKHVN
jgi:P27 family predicted phage terminase small subunit